MIQYVSYFRKYIGARAHDRSAAGRTGHAIAQARDSFERPAAELDLAECRDFDIAIAVDCYLGTIRGYSHRTAVGNTHLKRV